MLSRALIFTAALACLVGLVACNRPDWSTPVKAYISFSNALRKGDAKTAWGALSEASKQRFTDRAKAISSASDGGMSDNPMNVFIAGTGTGAAPEIKEVTLVREQGNDAWLSVVPKEGAAKEVRMVKEPDGWKLDVSEMLKD